MVSLLLSLSSIHLFRSRSDQKEQTKAFHSGSVQIVDIEDKGREIEVRKKVYQGIRLMNEAQRIMDSKTIQVTVKETDPFGHELAQLIDFENPVDLVPILSSSLDRLSALEKTSNKVTEKQIGVLSIDFDSPLNTWLLRARSFA